MLFTNFHPIYSMTSFITRSRQTKELKRLAAEGKPLSVMEDVVFKTMLSSDTEDSREALRCLLSACTRREISSVQVINGDLLPAHLAGKSSRLDVNVTFNDGEAANLEMQVDLSNDDLKARSSSYTAMLLAGQSKRGHGYGAIKRVYQIFFLNCVLFPQSDKLPRRYSYREETEHDQLNDLTEIIFYEMPKLERKLKGILAGTADMNGLSEEEKWCMFMKYRHEQRAAKFIEKLYWKEEGIMRAEKAVAGISKDYIKYIRQMGEIKNNMERASRIAYLQKEARATGHTEGREKRNLEIARKMKDRGRPLAEIAEDTDLSIETIAKL